MAPSTTPSGDTDVGNPPAQDNMQESMVLHRSLRVKPLCVVSARGCYLTLENGQQVLDATSGAAVACLGHGDERLQEAMIKQMKSISYAHAQVYTAAPIEDLARLLVQSTDGKMSRALFMSSGSEAIEIAMKLARQYHLEKSPPEPQRDTFLSRRQSYHGATLATLALSGHLARRARYEPLMLPNMVKTLPCNAYRYQKEGESDAAYVGRLETALEEDIKSCGPARVCAFVAETVGGASVGCVPPVPGYFNAVRRVCDKYGVLLILDEIMCGTGRTGTMHAWQQENIAPDIQTMAKGLGGGYMPIAAVLMNQRVFKALDDGSGAFSHGQTYQSHLLACATSLEVQRILQADGLIDRCRTMGLYLKDRLEVNLGTLPHVGDIRGRGLFVGIEFVRDKVSKTPFDPSAGIASKVHALALENGLATYPGTGTADGERGDHVLLAPPFVISEVEIDEMVEILARVVQRVTSSVG